MNIVNLGKNSPKIKELKKLELNKYRVQSGLFLVENHNTFFDALKSGFYPQEIYVTEEFLSDKQGELEKFLQKTKQNIPVFQISAPMNKHFSSLETPSGLAAVYPLPTMSEKIKGSVIYLNGLNDPGNVGTIIRSAVSFGIENIVIDEKCADPFGPKTISATKDAIFKVKIFKDKNREIIKQLQKQTTIVCATVSQNNTELSEVFKKTGDYCIVIGSEARGIDDEILALSHTNVCIKTSDKIESLNAACAASIFLYEFFRRN